MKINQFFIVIAIAVAAFTFACNKDKRAEFTTDKETYTQGATIITTNTSPKESKYYFWTFGGGSEIEGDAPTFKIPDDQQTGDFIITCRSTDNKNSSSSTRSSSKTVKITAAKQGQITVWMAGLDGAATNIKVSLHHNVTQENLSDTLYTMRSADPFCNSTANTVVFSNLLSGEVSITFRNLSNGDIFTKNVNIGGLECKSVQVQF